jgi:hypothetical protein
MAVHGDVWTWQVAKVAGDRSTAAWPTVGEELGAPQHVETDHYATEREGEEVRAHQLVNVDDGMPSLADAAGHGKAARRQAAEHIREQVLGQHLQVALPLPLHDRLDLVQEAEAGDDSGLFFLVVVTSSIRRTG